MKSDKIKNLCAYLDRNRPKNYPIGNKLLKDASDYVKNGYFKMLGVILQQGSDISADQRNLFQRMISGVACDYTIEDYLRQALEIEIEEYVNFTDQIKEMPLRFRFVLDALLLSAVEPKEDDQLALIADFAQSLTVSKAELSYLTQLAKAILTQSVSCYADAEELLPETIADEPASEYLENLIKGDLLVGNRMTIVQRQLPGQAENGTFQLNSIVKAPVIKLCNMKISLNQCRMALDGYEKVILQNCEFDGGNSRDTSSKFCASLHILNCHEVLVSRCRFTHFETISILENAVKKITFRNVRFEDCGYYYCQTESYWIPYGCVIHSDHPEKNGENSFVNCDFVNIHGRNGSHYPSSAFISDCKSTLENCNFNNCWHYHVHIVKDENNPKRTMFAAGSTAINCQVTDSAAIV